ncbi:MAG TPA: hypothetical protein VK886_14855, partial [Vicinamibacterales bacterium]|nr:hypothetical protein [Vicinamibacterales bacterium]
MVLANGQAYYARIHEQKDGFYRLTDVFYIVGQAPQQGQEGERPKASLIRRGRELHGPDQMFVNREHVLFIEPVSPSSRVG